MRLILALWFCFTTQFVFAQENSPFSKFGKVRVEDLQKRTYAIDSNANAVVLSDIGIASIEGNDKGWFRISFTRHKVVHILNRAAYELADVEIPLYSKDGVEEKLESLKAVTYNLTGNYLIKTKLEKSGIFKEKKDKNHVVRKFTFPNVKEGCMIEYEYKIKSDFIWNLDPWLFQGSFPVLWSEFRLSVPQFFTYAFLSHGYQPMHINQKKERQGSFLISNSGSTVTTTKNNFVAHVTDYRWVMKDVPELKPEKFSSALKNHIASIEFQLATRNPPLEYFDYRSTWPALSKSLLESENFGFSLQKDNNWLGDEIKPLLAGAKNQIDKAKIIFTHVRDNYTCINHNALYLNQTLRNVAKNKTGNVAEINILLTAMFRYAGLDASPVLLSTTDHGYAIEQYPMITSFNYVITRLTLNGKNIFLDASHPMLGFGKLLPDCYNGHAIVVNEEASSLNFSADSLLEKKTSILVISNDKKGNWIGRVEQTPGYFESYELREKISHQNGTADLLEEQKASYGFDVDIDSITIDSLNNYETNLRLHYEMFLKPGKQDKLYINPLFGMVLHDNPFKSKERFYPVEMPFRTDETYMLTMEVPYGYEIEELPEQMIANMDEEGSAYFEYRISHSNNVISLKTVMKISRTLFLPGEYSTLREFFKMVVEKQNERVVLKRKG